MSIVRFITQPHKILRDLQLSEHEKEELEIDFGFDLKGYDVIALLTEEEWESLQAERERKDFEAQEE
jgi:hypothetical protein